MQFITDDHAYDVLSDKDGIVIADENGNIIGGINQGDVYSDGSIVEDDVEEDDFTFTNTQNAWYYEPADAEDTESVGVLYITANDEVEIDDATVDANTKITVRYNSDDEIVSVTLDNVTLGSAAQYDGNDINNFDVASQTGAIVITFNSDDEPQVESYIEPTQPEWTAIDGGFAYGADSVNFSLTGSAFVDVDPMDNIPDSVGVVDGALQFIGDSFDTTPANFHVAGTGIEQGAKITVNGAEYTLADMDGDTTNGFELTEIITGWQTIEGGYTYLDSADDDAAAFTITADSFVDVDGVVGPDNISVENGALVFADDFDTATNLHVLGVEEGATVMIGDADYVFTDTDNDTTNGFELSAIEHPWSTVEGGFVYESGDVKFTMLGGEDADGNGEPDGVSYADGVISGVPATATINGAAIGITEASDADGVVSILLDEGTIGTIGGVSEGSTVGSALFVTFDEGVTAVTAAQGSHNLNGEAINVLNDADGVGVQFSDGSITGFSGVAPGASLTGTGVPASAAVTVDGTSAIATTGIRTISYTTDDADGYVVANNTITGLNNGTLLKPSSVGRFYVNGASLNLSEADYSIQGTADSARVYTPINAAADSLKPDTGNYNNVTLETDESGNIDTSDWSGRVAVVLDSSTGITNFNFNDVPAILAATLGNGDQNVTLPDYSYGGSGNTADIPTGSTGEKNIKGGNKTNRLINESTSAIVSMRGGTNADTFVAAGGALETIDVQDGGADVIYAPNGANIVGYNPSTGAMIQVDDPATKIAADTIYLDGNGALQLGDRSIAINSGQGTDGEGEAEGNVVVNLFDDDETITAGFTSADAESMDRSTSTAAEILIGNTNPSVVDKAGAAITGGSGADIIYAGAGDVVNGGGGTDLIAISDNRSDDNGTTVQMATGGGYDTVIGFQGGFDENDDVLSIPSKGTGTNALSFSRDGDVLTVALGAVRTAITGMFATDENASVLAALADEDDEVLTTTTNDASEDVDLVYDGSGVAQLRIEDRSNDNEIKNYTVIDNNNVATLDADIDLENAVFVGIGDIAVVDFGEVESDDRLVIDLGNTDAYQNINAVVASDNADTSIIGAAGTSGESLFAGLGNTTLDANTGGGNVMAGLSAAYQASTGIVKEGSTTFVYGSGYGFDTIDGFEAKISEDSETADRIALQGDFDETAVGGMLSYDGTNVTMTLDRRNALTITNFGTGLETNEANLQIRDAQYKVGSAMVYNEEVTGYIANENGSIVAGEDDGVEDATLWLAVPGYEDKTYTNIVDVNLSGATGNVFVAGNTEENEITGGVGGNTLWGGAGSEADTLIGSDDGSNMFVYLNHNGEDVIVTENDDDVVNLLNIGLEEINWADITIEDDQVAMGMNDGGKVQINSSADVSIQLQNGSQWGVDRENKTFRYKGQANA